MPDPSKPLRTVLLVEDDPVDAALIKRAFKITLFSRTLIHAVSGQGALDHLLADPVPMPDIVILDLILPDIPGYEVIRHMRGDARTRKVPIVVITGESAEASKTKCMEMGANFFLFKSVDTSWFKAEALQLEIEWLLSGGIGAAVS